MCIDYVSIWIGLHFGVIFSFFWSECCAYCILTNRKSTEATSHENENLNIDDQQKLLQQQKSIYRLGNLFYSKSNSKNCSINLNRLVSIKESNKTSFENDLPSKSSEAIIQIHFSSSQDMIIVFKGKIIEFFFLVRC